MTAIREMGAQRDVAGLAAPGRPKVLRAGRHIARYKRYIRHLAVDVEPADLAGEALRQAARGDGWVKVVGDWIDRSEGADSDLRPLWPREALAEAVAAAHDAAPASPCTPSPSKRSTTPWRPGWTASSTGPA